MAHILRPSLVLFRGLAELATQQGQGFPESVRIEILQTDQRECFPEYLSDRTRAAPMLSIKTDNLKLALIADSNFRGREKRIVQTP
jgi:hypothetical protein